MDSGRNLFGLTAQAKAKLLDRLAAGVPGRTAPTTPEASAEPGPRLDPAALDGSSELRLLEEASAFLGIDSPFFRMHDGCAGAESTIDGASYLNFASYNYLALNGDLRVVDAAKAAIDRYGTSVSASRPVSGERPIHRQLEAALARIHGTEDAVAMVSGHATNVTVIGQLVGRNDAILHDALIHNSVVQGALLSGARRVAFPHLDHRAADRLLGQMRRRHGNVLLVVEGHYSMDGDVPDLAAFVEVARRHRAWLMVDEAHALGVLGRLGSGSAEHAGIDPGEVDIWMGTLSKSLVSCGGYIAASHELVGYLKHLAPGFVFSVGMAPAAAAAALAALEILEREPERVQRVNANAALFLRLAREAGLDCGGSVGAAIVPIITGSSIRAARLARALFDRGVNVQPILYPAVPERSARLRFFLTAAHSEEQIRTAVRLLAEAEREVAADPTDLAGVARHLGRRIIARD